MGRPFSERVAAGDWRRDAEAWIRERLDAAGTEVTGPVVQPRIRPWSTQLTVPTDGGTVWFKANCRALAFEPVLHAALARLAPDAVEPPLAIDAERGWMLTADRGATLADAHEPTVEDWCRVVEEAARLQRIAADHADEVLATGLPDCSPSTVVDRFDRLVELFSQLPDRHPTHVSGDLRTQLLGVRPQIVDAAAELAASSLPVTWQHGDLHPGNVLGAPGGTWRLFDFGDGQWAHAAEVLSVPYGWITTRTSLEWPPVLESYREAWAVAAADLASQLRAAELTQPVNRTLLWWVCLEEATAAEWTTWGDGPLHNLTRVLDR